MQAKYPKVLALGCGLSAFKRDRLDGSIRDWVAEAVSAAVNDAGIEKDQIDSTIAAYESDHLAGQIGQAVIWQDTVGLTPKPVVRIEGCGATGGLAIRNAFAHLRAGLSDCILVVGAERVGKSLSSATASEVFAMSSDTDWEMPVGGHFTAYYALVMREHMRRYGTTEEQMALVSIKNHGNAWHHPLAQKPMTITVDDVMNSPVIASPFKRLDCSLLSDGAAALILATEDWAKKNMDLKKHPQVYLTGSGTATDYARAGDRPQEVFTQFSAKKAAAQAAYAMAGIQNPIKEIDLAEVYDSYTGAELMAYEALGFCDLGESGKMAEQEVFGLSGELVVNPSGGLLGFGAAAGATGIAQAVEVITQLRGEATKERQVRNARVGLTDAHAGVCTVCAVHIFESGQ